MRNRKDIENYIILGVLVIGAIAITLITYLINGNSKKSITDKNMEIGKSEQQKLEDASTEIGKSIDEVKKENKNEINNNLKVTNEKNNTNNTNSTNSTNEANASTTANQNANEVQNSNTEPKESDKNGENKKENVEITFKRPVNGKIIREFASENLVYSETLKEWIIHNGIDIGADKTTIVAASADGTVSAIKNDPRYGLTVIINHDNGYQTMYSNLLTAEFVVEGEKVSQGQTIGTVGNSASFEVCDEYHLHFELLKDNKYVDPTIYISFE